MIDSLRKHVATPGVSPAGKAYGSILLSHVDKHGCIDLDSIARPSFDLRRALPWRIRLKLARRKCFAAFSAHANSAPNKPAKK